MPQVLVRGDYTLMVVDAQALAESKLFVELPRNVREKILSSMREHKYEPGQVVVWAGEPCRSVYLVTKGVLRAYYSSLEGREYVLSYFSRGQFFHLSTAIDGDSFPFTVDVLSEATLYAIPCEQFRAILRDYPQMGEAVLLSLAAEVRRLNNMVEGLALHNVRTRLARFILDRADDVLPHRSWTQGDMAAHIGTVRDVVGRTLRDLAKDGIVRRERGRLVVINRAGLEREAMQDSL